MTVKELKNNLTKLWHQVIVANADGRCQWSTQGEHAGPVCGHHIFHKSRYKILKWDIINGFCLCRRCHYKVHSGGMETEFLIYIQENHPERWQYLVEKRKEISHYKKHDFEAMLKSLEERL